MTATPHDPDTSKRPLSDRERAINLFITIPVLAFIAWVGIWVIGGTILDVVAILARLR